MASMMELTMEIAAAVSLLRQSVEQRAQEQAIQLLHQLADGQLDSELWRASGAVDAICTAMASNPAASSMQETGCLALGQLARQDSDLQSHIASAGGVVRILASLRTHTTLAVLVVEAIRALRHVLEDHTANIDSFSATDGIAILLSAMQAHPTVPAVQIQGCRLIGALAVAEGSALLMAHLGGVAIIEAAMQTFLSDASVQEQACSALCALNLGATMESVTAVVAAMRMHRSVLAVQSEGVRALSLAAKHPAARDIIVAAHGVTMLVIAMRLHPSASGLQEEACRALFHLAVTDHQHAIVTQGGRAAILVAMARFPAMAAIQDLGLRALHRLPESTPGTMPGHWVTRGWRASAVVQC